MRAPRAEAPTLAPCVTICAGAVFQTARRGIPLGFVLVFACVSAVLMWARPVFAAFEYNGADWEGTSELLELARERLGRERVVITATIDYEELGPDDGILVLHPEIEIDQQEMGAFLAAGGRLAVVDDHGRGAAFLAHYRIFRVRAPLRPATTLRDNANLALAVPAVQLVAGVEQNRHPLAKDVEQVVTNHPVALTHPDLTPVLQIPAVGEPSVPLAVTGVIAKRGRLLAMGDPSVLINLMLRYPGNRAFAGNLVEYLADREDPPATNGKLYLVANRFGQRGSYGGVSGPGREVRAALEGLEDALRSAHDTGIPGSAALLLAGLGLLLAAIWAGLHSLRIYRRYVPRYALPTPLVAQGGVVGRAAVLAAKTTDRALVLAELRSALAEALSDQLGIDARAASPRLLSEVAEKRVLSPERLEELRALLVELDGGVSHLASVKRLKIPERRVEELHQKMMALLTEIGERTGKDE
jgi:hypothetical protein